MSDVRPVASRKRRRRRARYVGPVRRRQHVLEVATDLFTAGGFAATTMDIVAERCDVSKAVVYDAFPGGKEALFTATLDRAVGALTTEAVPDDEEDVEAAIAAEVRSMIGAARRSPGAFHLVFEAPGTLDPKVEKRWRAARRAVESPVRARLGRVLDTEDELTVRIVLAGMREAVRVALAADETERSISRSVASTLAQGVGAAD